MIFREQKWFDTHIEQGNLYIYPLYGTLVNPINTPIAIRDCILHCFDIDGLKTLMFQLKRIMETKSEKDRIIYIHCAAGKDRTGEASACYLMEYKQYSYKEAVQLNEKIAGRSIEASNMNAIRWYAFYLRDVKHAFWIGDIEGY
jgi:protein-tyrosine phosphatase